MLFSNFRRTISYDYWIINNYYVQYSVNKKCTYTKKFVRFNGNKCKHK